MYIERGINQQKIVVN